MLPYRFFAMLLMLLLIGACVQDIPPEQNEEMFVLEAGPDDTIIEFEDFPQSTGFEHVSVEDASKGAAIITHLTDRPDDPLIDTRYTMDFEPGTYEVRARGSFPSPDEDSFWFGIDDDVEMFNVLNPPSGWQEIHVGTFDLDGMHALSLGHRESGALLDALRITRVTSEENETMPDDGTSGADDERPVSTTYGARDVPRSKTPSASDTYVSPDGSGSACMSSDPCSLSTGIDKGGFVWLQDGTYRPTSDLRLGSGVVLEALTPKQAIIDFEGRELRMVLQSDNVLRNLIVRNSRYAGSGAIMIFGDHNLIEGVISENHLFSGFQTWAASGYDDTKNPDGASYNTFRDSIGRYNSENCMNDGGPPCSDSDADGFSISNGRGNVIEHSEAYGNADDGFDLWASYESSIQNSIAHSNGFNDAGQRIGNGMGFKSGSGAGYAPVPNGHEIAGNWGYDNEGTDFTRNGGEGAMFEENVCGHAKEPCGPSW